MAVVRAHNPKAVGSNPAPATKEIKGLRAKLLSLFFCRPAARIRPAHSGINKKKQSALPEVTKDSRDQPSRRERKSTLSSAHKGRRENDAHADHGLRGHGRVPDLGGQQHGQGRPVGLMRAFTFHPNQLFFNVFQFVAHESRTFAFTTVHKRALPRVDARRSRVEITSCLLLWHGVKSPPHLPVLL